MTDNQQKLFVPWGSSNKVPITVNAFAKYQLELQCGEFEKLESELLFDEDAYARAACKRLGKDFCSDLYLDKKSDVPIEHELSKILSGYLGRAISAGDELKCLDEQLKKCLEKNNVKPASLGLKKGDSRSAANIVKIIEAYHLPFELSSKENMAYHIYEKEGKPRMIDGNSSTGE